jgi:hypothetical protein
VTPFDHRLPVIAAEARVKTCHVFHCWQAMREMGRRFHVAAFAQFAGLDNAHVAAIIAALETNDAMPDKRSPLTRRAHRLADDWTVPDDWIDWAVAERRWSPTDAREEAEIFANYWQARSGAGAAKLDWRKTWQNWVRTSRRPNGDYRLYTDAVDPRAHMERTAALYDRMGRTNEAKEIRDGLAASANVIPFTTATQKMAQNGGK